MFLQFAPPASLARFVDFLWVNEEEAPTAPARVKEHALPTGLPELIITLRCAGEHHLRVVARGRSSAGVCLPAAIVRGAHSEWYFHEATPVVSQVGAHFKAGGAAPFFPASARELLNSHIALHDLWGASALEVAERLVETPTPAARARLLAQALLAHVSRPVERHPAVDYALRVFEQSPHSHTVAEVAHQIGLSQRYFRALFQAEVGLAPKRYCRVRRFLQVLRHLPKGASVDLANLALAYGYYDQAHLSNEFRALGGMCPTAYIRDRNPLFFTYVPLPE
jgi:AraC-like DNA-binding protein